MEYKIKSGLISILERYSCCLNTSVRFLFAFLKYNLYLNINTSIYKNFLEIYKLYLLNNISLNCRWPISYKKWCKLFLKVYNLNNTKIFFNYWLPLRVLKFNLSEIFRNLVKVPTITVLLWQIANLEIIIFEQKKNRSIYF